MFLQQKNAHQHFHTFINKKNKKKRNLLRSMIFLLRCSFILIELVSFFLCIVARATDNVKLNARFGNCFILVFYCRLLCDQLQFLIEFFNFVAAVIVVALTCQIFNLSSIYYWYYSSNRIPVQRNQMQYPICNYVINSISLITVDEIETWIKTKFQWIRSIGIFRRNNLTSYTWIQIHLLFAYLIKSIKFVDFVHR